MTRTTDPVRLAIDSGSEVGSVALACGDRILAECAVDVKVKQSEALLPAIDAVLRESQVSAAELHAVVVGAGPGSFTGVRVGAATAKGLAHALRIPLLAVSTLEATAAAADARHTAVCALLDARRGQVYAACYGFGGDVVEVHLEPTAARVEEVVAALRERRPIYVGEGAAAYAGVLRDAGAESSPGDEHRHRARAMLLHALRYPSRAPAVEIGAWEPTYLRESGAERNLRR